MGRSARHEGESADARVVGTQDLAVVGTEESSSVGQAGGADKEQLGGVDEPLPFGQQVADILDESLLVVAAEIGTGGVGGALGVVVGGLRTTLLATGGVSVEGLVHQDDGFLVERSSGTMLGLAGVECNDHGGKMAAADHAHEDVLAGVIRGHVVGVLWWFAHGNGWQLPGPDGVHNGILLLEFFWGEHGLVDAVVGVFWQLWGGEPE